MFKNVGQAQATRHPTEGKSLPLSLHCGQRLLHRIEVKSKRALTASLDEEKASGPRHQSLESLGDA